MKHLMLVWVAFCSVIFSIILMGVGAAHATPLSFPLAAPATVVLNGSQLAQIKQQLQAGDPTLQAALNQELVVANPDLTAGPWSVMDKTTVPPSGSKHDYISLSRYYWPTPGSSNGCPYIHKDGQTNPATASNAYDHASRHAAMDAIFNLSVAWYFTGQQSYANRAELDVRMWFLNPATAMNPNVNFGEEIPCNRKGGATGVLNWTEVMGELLDGLAILDSGAPGWTAADQAEMHTWLTSFLNWLQTNSLARSEAAAVNNHGTYYDVGVSALELYLGQTAQAKAVVTTSEIKRLDSQIAANGQQPQETTRTNSWGYSNWNLEGLCRLALTASHVGVNLWAYKNPKGGTIAKAADYMIPGAEKGKSVWPFQQISPFDQTWPVSEFHAASDFAGDKAAGAAISQIATSAGGDLWVLLPVCVEAAIQPN